MKTQASSYRLSIVLGISVVLSGLLGVADAQYPDCTSGSLSCTFPIVGTNDCCYTVTSLPKAGPHTGTGNPMWWVNGKTCGIVFVGAYGFACNVPTMVRCGSQVDQNCGL
jgi:hypothetical protein